MKRTNQRLEMREDGMEQRLKKKQLKRNKGSRQRNDHGKCNEFVLLEVRVRNEKVMGRFALLRCSFYRVQRHPFT